MGKESLISTSRRFPSDAQSVSAARHYVREVLRDWNLEFMSDEVELVTSELTTNSVLHAQSSPTVSLDRRGDTLRLEVSDSSEVLPVQRHFAPTAGTGRGIGLVDAVSSTWGTLARSNGKTVWCEFEIPGNN